MPLFSPATADTYLEPAYLFIDAGHLRQYYSSAVTDWFGGPGEIDYSGLKRKVGAFKLFYYDCRDEIQRPNESEDDLKGRIEEQERGFDKIRSIVGAHVRLGVLAGKRQRRRRQKGVDILLAVDMMNHAIRQNMRRTVLLSGDADFKPLVESLIQIGTFVEVIGDAAHTSQSLTRAADQSSLWAFEEYFGISAAALQEKYPLPAKRTITCSDGYYEGSLVGAGKIGDHAVRVSHHNSQFHAFIPKDDGKHADVLSHPIYERLKLFISIQFPDVVLKE
jgi:uncharacterized LabA/DUF88 family protein